MTEIFEEVCPYYLAIGMSLAEYWEGSPHLVKYYRQAHRMKREEENQRLWLQGLYFHDALNASLSNLFKKKGSKAAHYMAQPLEIFPKTEEEKEKEAIKERQKAVDYFNKLIKLQQLRKKQKGDEIDGGND